jgi:SAM-dependent methyltransferase
MYNDAVDLWDFYGTSLGHVARRLIRRRIRGIWPNVSGMNMLGLGYATPYLRPFRDEAERVFALMPAQQGVLHWPRDGRNLVGLADESELPLQDVSVDRVLLVHGLECSEQLRPMLHEIWRVLTGNGRLLVVVPNRRGLWSRLERTPFGHGHPYSTSQLSRVLRANMFTPTLTTRALYVPPYPWPVVRRSAYGIEDIGARWFKQLGGVVIMEASKQIYATTKPRPLRARARALLPVPAARIPATSSIGSRHDDASASSSLAITQSPD